MNVKELTHSHKQAQSPKTHKKKPTIRLTTRVTMLCVPPPPPPPPKVPSLQIFILDEVKCKTHTQQSTSSTQTGLEIVNLTDNLQTQH